MNITISIEAFEYVSLYKQQYNSIYDILLNECRIEQIIPFFNIIEYIIITGIECEFFHDPKSGVTA